MNRNTNDFYGEQKTNYNPVREIQGTYNPQARLITYHDHNSSNISYERRRISDHEPQNQNHQNYTKNQNYTKIQTNFKRPHFRGKNQKFRNYRVKNSEMSKVKGGKTNIRNNNGEVEIFIHGLHPITTKEDLKDLFLKYCKIQNLSFKRNPRTGKHKGFAFFTVQNQSIAAKIIDKAHYLHKRLVYCQIKEDNPDRNKAGKKRLFVGGLPPTVTDWELMEIFEQFGELRTAYMIRDRKGKPRNFGYVDFKELRGVEATIGAQPIFVKGKMVEIRRYKLRGQEEGSGLQEKKHTLIKERKKKMMIRIENNRCGDQQQEQQHLGDLKSEDETYFCQKFGMKCVLRISKLWEFQQNSLESTFQQAQNTSQNYQNIRLNMITDQKLKFQREKKMNNFEFSENNNNNKNLISHNYRQM